MAAFRGVHLAEIGEARSEPMAPARNVVPERGLPKTKTSRSFEDVQRRPSREGSPLDRARVETDRATRVTLRCAAYALETHRRARRACSSWRGSQPRRLVFVPVEDDPGKADAVVVLSGSKHERLDRGLGLMREGSRPCSSSRAASTRASRGRTGCARKVATASGSRASRPTPTPHEAKPDRWQNWHEARLEACSW